MKLPLCVTSQAEEFQQGLFGNIFYNIFQILPHLYTHKIFPAWQIRSTTYGDPPEFLTIPGALDLAYAPPVGPYRFVSVEELRRRHAHVLGNDWEDLHRIWNAYFKIPHRVQTLAQQMLPPGRVLGIHYRGTDKQTATWDSNPITQDQYLTLIRDFQKGRADFDVIFAATDEFSFVEKLRSAINLPVISLGEVEFHLATEHKVSRSEKTDRAMLDCILLSLCSCVIETSSALPSFAKLFNPALEIYRCAASKLFGKLYTDMPYFPVAYIPMLPVTTSDSVDILRQTMESDWTGDPRMARYCQTFSSSPRWPFNHRLYNITDKLGVSKIAAKLLPVYR